MQHVTCQRCSVPLAAPEFAPVQGTCLACGEARQVALPTHGGARRAELGIKALFTRDTWLDALGRRDAEGFVIADRCEGCEGPVVVRADAPLHAECTHCHEPQDWRVGDHVVDALPASRITGQTWGGGMSLRFEPSLIEATVDGPSPCVGCGGELPPFRGVQRCGFCGRTFYAILSCGRRFLVGFHVEGDDEGSAVDGWVPIGEAVEHYAARRELASRSNKSTFKAIGLWLILGPLVIAGLFGCGCIFLGFGTALLPPEYVGLIPMLAFAGFGLGALLLFALFGALVFSRVVKHRRDRAEITRGLAPLAVKGIPPRG